jgi:hypothetical protein
MPHCDRASTSSPGGSRRGRDDALEAARSPLKRMRVQSPEVKSQAQALTSPTLTRRLPPLHTLTTGRAAAAAAAGPTDGGRERNKLDQLREAYLADVALVLRKLQAALGMCKHPHVLPCGTGQVRKLEKSVETLQKLFKLLSAQPAPRLRGPAHLSLLCAVESQIKTQVLPVATVIRSFEHVSALLEPKVAPASSSCGLTAAASKSVLLSPRSPSAVLPVSSCCSSSSSTSSSAISSSSSAPAVEKDKASDTGSSWRYLSMVLSLQL